MCVLHSILGYAGRVGCVSVKRKENEEIVRPLSLLSGVCVVYWCSGRRTGTVSPTWAPLRNPAPDRIIDCLRYNTLMYERTTKDMPLLRGPLSGRAGACPVLGNLCVVVSAHVLGWSHPSHQHIQGENPPYRQTQTISSPFPRMQCASRRLHAHCCRTHMGGDHRSYRWLVTPTSPE